MRKIIKHTIKEVGEPMSPYVQAKIKEMAEKIADIRADRKIKKIMFLKRAIKLSYLSNVLTATGYKAMAESSSSEIDDFILDSGRGDDLINSFKVY